MPSTRTTSAYSAAFPIVEPMIVYWFQNRRRISIDTRGPDVAPQVTSRPPFARQRNDSSHVASPTFSITTSTPRFAVSARISAATLWVVWLIVTSAPRSRARASFSSEDEAYRIANDVEYGLAAGVWTSDIARAHRATRALRVGTVWVNTYQMVYPSVPYGGVKQSGHGRNLGEASLDEFTQTKSVWMKVS